VQPQSRWIEDAQNKINIRYDAVLKQIEDACRISVNRGSVTKVLRLEDVTESTQGIIPYRTQEDGKRNAYIKPYRDVPPDEPEWKPMLDGNSFVGRYELRWEKGRPYLKYGKWLCRPRVSKYFESPKLLVQDMRNRALKRRLVANFDDQKFYNRHNFSNIIAKDIKYNIKYILALFNSSIPEDVDALNMFFAAEERKRSSITDLLVDIKLIDAEIDERVLDLYGITNVEDRRCILGSAPLEEDKEISSEEESEKILPDDI
jgi:hypothetical protein